jgi:N-acetylmuramoyl-L-alanine amidase
VPGADVTLLPPGAPLPRPVAGNVRVLPDERWVDVRIPMGERAPFLIEQEERALILTLHGARNAIDNIVFVENDSLIQTIFATQELTDRVRVIIRLGAPLLGYQAWHEGTTLVLRVRRPPEVNLREPLRGRVIVVDAGHPPAGATGPTGLYEAVPALAIARRLQAALEARGATVVMTRTTDEPLALGERPIISRRANGDAFVSIHLNAYPDGINPFVNNGTGTYYFQPHSEPLARMVQKGMIRRMGLRDNGVFYNTFAVTRTSWMPAILTEGAFMMIPEQEAALRTPQFQEAYALGVVDGLEDYFRAIGLASGSTPR